MEKTIFERIIDREVPADIIYEDEHTLAFLNNAPNVPGHTLVIPKKPFVNIFDIDDETLTAVMRTVRLVAPAVRDGVGAKGVNINSNHGAEAGQEVFHLHFHIIPRHAVNSVSGRMALMLLTKRLLLQKKYANDCGSAAIRARHRVRATCLSLGNQAWRRHQLR